MRIGGWIPRRPDMRCPLFAFGAIARLDRLGEARTIVLAEGTPITDQGRVPSCVAASVCDALEIRAHNTGRPVRQLSRAYLHWTARSRDGSQDDPESGTYTQSAIAAMRKLGVCSAETYPDTESPTAVPFAAAFVEAATNRLDGFRVVQSLGEVDSALAKNYPVLLAAVVYSDFEHARATYIPSGRAPLWGGHMMVIVGVRHVDRRRQYLVRNSWGEGWGEGGRTWVDEVFVASAHELCVVSSDGQTSLWDDVA